MAEETTTTTTQTQAAPQQAESQSTGQSAPGQSTEPDVVSELQARLDRASENSKRVAAEKKEVERALKEMRAAEAERQAELQARADKELEAKGDWEARIKSQEKQHLIEKEAIQKERDMTAAALRKAVVENSVISAATEAKAVSPAQIMAIFGNLFTMDDSMTKAIVNVDACKSAGIDPYDGAEIKSVKALMADLAKDERNLNLFQPTLPQGGAGSTQPLGKPGSAKQITEADWSAMSHEEKSAILSDEKLLREYRNLHKT